MMRTSRRQSLQISILMLCLLGAFGIQIHLASPARASCTINSSTEIGTTPSVWVDYGLQTYEYAVIYEKGFYYDHQFVGCHYYYAQSVEVWQNLNFSYSNSAVWLYDHSTHAYLTSVPGPIENGFTPGDYPSNYTLTVYAPNGVDAITGYRFCTTSDKSSCGSYTRTGYFGPYV